MRRRELLIRRRHVIFVEGNDPQGPEGYYRLFDLSWRRFLKVWSLNAQLGELHLDSQELAHWQVETSGPNWLVSTRYDFLRMEDIIAANMAEPLLRHCRRVLAWGFDYLLSGTIFRVLRASPYFGFALIYIQMMLISWILLSLAVGWLIGLAVTAALGLPGFAGLLIGIPTAIMIFLALRPLAHGGPITQGNSGWAFLCKFARGEDTCFDSPIEAGAQRVIAAVRANEVDEIIVVGHSAGGALAPAMIARALDLDPNVGRRGPPLVLLTLGSIAPGVALHPKAERLRTEFARLAAEPSVLWIDCQSPSDRMNFSDFDPIEGIGAHVAGKRCNPLIWNVHFGDMSVTRLLPSHTIQLLLLLHFQFITARVRRAPYDYFMLVCGPMPVASWATNSDNVFAAFEADGSLREDRVISAAAVSLAPSGR